MEKEEYVEVAERIKNEALQIVSVVLILIRESLEVEEGKISAIEALTLLDVIKGVLTNFQKHIIKEAKNEESRKNDNLL